MNRQDCNVFGVPTMNIIIISKRGEFSMEFDYVLAILPMNSNCCKSEIEPVALNQLNTKLLKDLKYDLAVLSP